MYSEQEEDEGEGVIFGSGPSSSIKGTTGTSGGSSTSGSGSSGTSGGSTAE